MKTSTSSSDTARVLTADDIATVSGGIVEKIEKGDEFMTIEDHIIRSINAHPLFWDPLGTGWNKYP